MSPFRESVYRDAKAAGMSDELARIIAEGVADHDVPATRAAAVRRADQLGKLCHMYGAGSLMPTLLRSSVSVREAVPMLEAATGTRRFITESGLAAIKMTLASRTHWRAAA